MQRERFANLLLGQEKSGRGEQTWFQTEERQLRLTIREMFRVVACILFGITASISYAHAQGPEAKLQAGQSAQAFLHSIYDRYIGSQDKARPIDYSKPSQLKEYFEPSLAEIIHKDFVRAEKAGDVPTLDADPFIDAQDWEIKSFDIQVNPVDADHANAVVKFDNAGEHKVLHLQLVRIAGNWRIHDIDYGGTEGTLRGLYKAAK